jgi:hypothetical protein
METEINFGVARRLAVEEFLQIQSRAQTEQHLRWLFPARALETFGNRLPDLQPNRRPLGTVDIPVERIIGTVDRGADFDGSFRPLAAHLRDRWVDVYLLARRANWPPIRAFKVGENYYVEDGHNRVSVARALGMLSIRAEVWEYPIRQVPPDDPVCCPAIRDLPCAGWPEE